jgi:hypothetical protein
MNKKEETVVCPSEAKKVNGKCTPEQIKKCHGNAKTHSCEK